MMILGRVVWAMMRPPVVFLLFLYAASGLAVSGSTSVVALARAMVVLVPFLAFSAVVNDLADARIDAVNLPADARRVLVGGRAHRRHLWIVAAAGAAGTVAASVGLGGPAVAVAGAGLAVSTAYSIGPVRLADRGAVASLTLPACYVAVPYLLGAIAGRGRVVPTDLPFLGGLYVGFIARIILKDFRDVRGDALFGKRTFLVRHGRVPTCRVSAGCWVAASVLVVTLSPHRTPAMVVSTVASAGLAVWLLGLLATAREHRTEERIISALAIVGRGAVLVAILPLWARAASTPPVVAELLVAGVAVLSGGQALEMLRHGPARVARVRLAGSGRVGSLDALVADNGVTGRGEEGPVLREGERQALGILEPDLLVAPATLADQERGHGRSAL
jgi:4-hydroxybenzoate polyprenyltransferase